METLNAIQTFLSTHWELIVFAFTALGLSAALQKVKHKLEIESPKVMLAVTSVISFLAVAIPGFLGWINMNPDVLGSYSAFVFTAMTLLYRYVVQPSSAFLSDVKEFKQAQASASVAPTPAPSLEGNVEVSFPLKAAAPAKEFDA